MRVLSVVASRCGSGAVSTYLASELQRLGHAALFLASDVNPLAAAVATNTARINGVQTFDVARTDLLHSFEPRIRVRAAVFDGERGGRGEEAHGGRCCAW